MKKVIVTTATVLTLVLIGVSSNSNAQTIGNDDGKKCKNSTRCPGSNFIQCDEFGTGLECVCFVC